jgi:GIY-YIG catalytic domain-containing protein
VLAALCRIDREGVPPSRANRSVELRHDHKRYPPKLVVSFACEVATGQELSSSEFITADAERYLQRLGFSVVRIGQQAAASESERASSAPRSVIGGSSSSELAELGRQLVYASRLYRWRELKGNPILPPRSPGVYAWFFERVPPGVPTDSCVIRDGATLLYVGISPKNRRTKGTLQDRLWSHFEGIAEFSTLRTTLGCLLEAELGAVLRRVGSGKTQSFAGKESALSEWMADHARVAWIETPKPWLLEDHLLKTLSLPLNIQGNANQSLSRNGSRNSETGQFGEQRSWISFRGGRPFFWSPAFPKKTIGRWPRVSSTALRGSKRLAPSWREKAQIGSFSLRSTGSSNQIE